MNQLIHLKEIANHSNVNGSDTSIITNPIITTPAIIIPIFLVKFSNLYNTTLIIRFKPVCAIIPTINSSTRTM